MKSFTEQLQDFTRARKNAMYKKQSVIKLEQIRLLGHMINLLEALGVLQNIPKDSKISLPIERHMITHLLVNKYYGPK